MSEDKGLRLSKAATQLNVSVDHLYETLEKNNIPFERKPMWKLSPEAMQLLFSEYSDDMALGKQADHLLSAQKLKRDSVTATPQAEVEVKPEKRQVEFEESNEKLQEQLEKIKGTGDKKAVSKKLAEEAAEKETVETPDAESESTSKTGSKAKKEPDVIKAEGKKLTGPKIEGKIDLEEKPKRGKKKKEEEVVTEQPAETKPATKGRKKAVAEPDKPAEVEAEKAPVAETPAEPTQAETVAKPEEIELHRVKIKEQTGPKVLGRIELPAEKPKAPVEKKPVASSSGVPDRDKKKRKRKDSKVPTGTQSDGNFKFDRDRRGFSKTEKQPVKTEATDKEIQDQIKLTLDRLRGAGQKSKSSKERRRKRDQAMAEAEAQQKLEEGAKKKIQVTEFVSANDLSRMMNLSVTQIISTCMSLGMFVSINQRLDAETIAIVAEEFGYEVEFVAADVQEAINETPDKPEDLESRPPIITVMGHVDHGKTSLLDYIRNTNVIAGEAGGITQHIGAYEVTMENGRKITFLDTPGHEAFTAMRARGAKVTDVAIIVVSADDSVMPQTIEAINHAQAAGVPIVFAINKIDKPGANPDRIREQLSAMNILVEEWGGKYQSQEISAKKGLNIDKLLDKVLLEADLLDLKANPKKNAKGTTIEASLDKGRGYVATVLVQTGSMKVGDVVLAGCYSGRVKAMFNERGQKLEKVGPSEPVILLGLNGAPQAGDQFNVMDDEREAREIANRRLQLQREQGIRTHKHITLDEIGRRLAIGNFKELNLIVKGDVDGSVEALSDSLLKLSNDEIQINVIHKSVGQISESDVLLASASEAIIIGFQVRPSANARKLAENEQIDIRLYSVIYDAINEVKDAMEGMLQPEYEDKITCNIEVRETFKIPKVGTIAGCMVTEGKVNRNTKVRIVRDGIVVFTGELDSLKRFKDDVKEVLSGYECGLNIKNFNDIKVGDIIEGYETITVKRTLA